MKKDNKIQIGLFGVGLDTYWGQFEGLLDNLKKYQRLIKEKMESFNVTIVDAGMVDNPQKAREAADLLKSEDVEIVFLYISTYALSSTVLPIAQKVKVPNITIAVGPTELIGMDSPRDRNYITKTLQPSKKNTSIARRLHIYGSRRL